MQRFPRVLLINSAICESFSSHLSLFSPPFLYASLIPSRSFCRLFAQRGEASGISRAFEQCAETAGRDEISACSSTEKRSHTVTYCVHGGRVLALEFFLILVVAALARRQALLAATPALKRSHSQRQFAMEHVKVKSYGHGDGSERADAVRWGDGYGGVSEWGTAEVASSTSTVTGDRERVIAGERGGAQYPTSKMLHRYVQARPPSRKCYVMALSSSGTCITHFLSRYNYETGDLCSERAHLVFLISVARISIFFHECQVAFEVSRHRVSISSGCIQNTTFFRDGSRAVG